MFKPRPLGLCGGHRSDRHGVIERDPTLALSGPILDPVVENVTEVGAHCSGSGLRMSSVSNSKSPDSTSSATEGVGVDSGLPRKLSTAPFVAESIRARRPKCGL